MTKRKSIENAPRPVLSKEEVNELYHLLRRVSLSDNYEETFALQGLMQHLSTGGDYLSLLKFTDWYGSTFLAEAVRTAIVDFGVSFDRIVDIGSGLGWLGRTISSYFGMIPIVTIDKRRWTGVDYTLDIEEVEDLEKLISLLEKDDLVVMGQVVHCVRQPEVILQQFSHWPLLIVEYNAEHEKYGQSYIDQCIKYGAEPFIPDQDFINTALPNRRTEIYQDEPYLIILADKLKLSREQKGKNK